MSESVIETRTTKIWLGADGIIRIVTKPGVSKQTLADAVENMEAVDRVRLGKKRPAFIDIRKAMSTDAEGRRYYSRTEHKETVSAAAFIVGSPISRMIGSLFLGLNRPPFPLVLFDSEDKALEWLKGFVTNE